MAPPAVGHAQEPLIPPPTVLTLIARHFHAPPHKGSESPSPASHRPRLPEPFTPPRAGSAHEPYERALGSALLSSAPPPSVQAPLPGGHAHNKLSRSQATPPVPLAIPGPAPRGPLRATSSGSCSGGDCALRRPRACCGAAAWRLCKVFLPRCISDPLLERETTPTETRLKAGGLRLGNICLPHSEHASPTQ